MSTKVKLRKQILVEKQIQFHFAKFVIIFSLATAVITSSAVFFTSFTLLGERLASVYPQGRLIEVFRQVWIAFGGIILISIPIIFYLSIRFSHRFVGPLPKIYRVLRDVGEGNFNQEIHLREKDELRELASVINSMIRNLRQRHPGSKKHANQKS